MLSEPVDFLVFSAFILSATKDNVKANIWKLYMKFEANKEFMENLSLHVLLDGTGNVKIKNKLVFFDKHFINVRAHFWPTKLRTATKPLRSHLYPNIFNQ